MKIIDKRGRKDYYDFLVGIYGEDPKIVFDRRSEYNYEPMKGKNSLYLCGKVYDIYFDGNRCYIGDDIKQFDTSTSYQRWRSSDYIFIDRVRYELSPIFDKKGLNRINSTPILVSGTFGLVLNPLLSSLNLNNYISPDDIFLSVSSWISNEIDEKLKIINNLTDTQKLESKGFDKKTSFRPNIK